MINFVGKHLHNCKIFHIHKFNYKFDLNHIFYIQVIFHVPTEFLLPSHENLKNELFFLLLLLFF